MFSYDIYRFDRLIKKLGIPATLHQVSSTFNPTTGMTSSPVTTDTPVIAVVSLTQDTFERKADVEDTVYEILISNVALGVTPHIGDQVIVNGTTYRVVVVGPGFIGPSIASWQLEAVG